MKKIKRHKMKRPNWEIKILSMALLLVMGTNVLAAKVAEESVNMKSQDLAGQKIEKNNMSNQILKDMDLIEMGINGYRNKYGGFPLNDKSCSISSKTNCAVGEWNEANFYINQDIGSRWSYRRIVEDGLDQAVGVIIGYAVIKTSKKHFNLLTKKEIAEILRERCMNETIKEKTNKIDMISNDDSECVIAIDKVMHKK